MGRPAKNSPTRTRIERTVVTPPPARVPRLSKMEALRIRTTADPEVRLRLEREYFTTAIADRDFLDRYERRDGGRLRPLAHAILSS
jgi:hypothetical protein